jgi:hypothetical protein
MSIFTKLFGECYQTQIIETFIENNNERLYIADLVRMLDVPKISVIKTVKKLFDEGTLIKSGKAGNVQFYQLNLENPKVKVIILLNKYVETEKLEDLFKEQ